MAIRPTIVGPLLDGVSARTSRGYVHVETFTSTVDPDPFRGDDPGPGAIIHTNGSIKDRRFMFLRQLPISVDSTLVLTQDVTLTGAIEESVDNTLTLSQDVVVDHDINKTLDDTLVLTQTLTPNFVLFFDLGDTLVLTDDAHLTYEESLDDTLAFTHDVEVDITRYLEHTLTITDEVICNVVRSFGFSDTLALSEDQDEQNLTTFEVSDILALTQNVSEASLNTYHVVSTLALSQSLRYSPRREELSHTLSLSHSVRQGLANAYIEQSLALSQTVIINCDREISFSDSLTLTDAGVRTVLGDASNTLTLTQSLVQSKGYYNTLELTQDVAFELAKFTSSILDLSQTTTLRLVLLRATTHSLALSHTVSVLNNNPSMCQYAPQSSVIPTTLTLTKQDTVTYVCGVESLTLRAPVIGDDDTRKYQQIIRETQGGSLRGYRRSTWPKTKILSYTFEDLCTSSADEILDFLAFSLGKAVTLTDYYGNDWSGIITTPDARYVEAGRGIGTITIDFQGEPV